MTRPLHLPFDSQVSGVSHRAATANAAQVGDRVVCRREPTNPFDPNAVCVEGPGGRLGYLPRSLSGRAAAQLGDSGEFHGTVVECHRSSESRFPSVRIRITRIVATQESNRTVYGPGGRELGELVDRDGDWVVVATPQGQARYPSRLVNVADAQVVSP